LGRRRPLRAFADPCRPACAHAALSPALVRRWRRHGGRQGLRAAPGTQHSTCGILLLLSPQEIRARHGSSAPARPQSRSLAIMFGLMASVCAAADGRVCSGARRRTPGQSPQAQACAAARPLRTRQRVCDVGGAPRATASGGHRTCNCQSACFRTRDRQGARRRARERRSAPPLALTFRARRQVRRAGAPRARPRGGARGRRAPAGGRPRARAEEPRLHLCAARHVWRAAGRAAAGGRRARGRAQLRRGDGAAPAARAAARRAAAPAARGTRAVPALFLVLQPDCSSLAAEPPSLAASAATGGACGGLSRRAAGCAGARAPAGGRAARAGGARGARGGRAGAPQGRLVPAGRERGGRAGAALRAAARAAEPGRRALRCALPAAAARQRHALLQHAHGAGQRAPRRCAPLARPRAPPRAPGSPLGRSDAPAPRRAALSCLAPAAELHMSSQCL